MPLPDDALAVLIDCFIASGDSSPRHMAGAAAARRVVREGGWGFSSILVFLSTVPT